jgi:multiple sugar transport system permease protein
MAGQTVTPSKPMLLAHDSALARPLRRILGPTLLVLFAALIVSIFLLPLVYMITVAFRDDKKMAEGEAPWYPAQAASYTYNGEEYPVFLVPIDGGLKPLALIKKGRTQSDFVDPKNPGAGPITWQGSWRTLSREWSPYFSTQNFGEAWRQVNFPQLFRNSLIVAIGSLILDLIACTLIAYGFARFRIPGKNILFWVLISTILLPSQVTAIPLFTFFTRIGWGGTWLPLIIPSAFGNAFDIFLIRQFMMAIPKEMDEAAMIDGAGPVKTLTSIILPQLLPVLIAVAMFHFFFKWNDFFLPLIYLFGKESLFTIPLGLLKMNDSFGSFPGLAMAGAMIAVALPVTIFIIAQRYFMQGVVVTGVEK